MTISVRNYTLADYEALLTIQKEAFPPPFPEELWWSKDQIRSHIETFPEGAMIAEIDGEPAGSATALMILFDGKPHTWDEVADEGYIARSHNRKGDSLYGIDVCVRPEFRGKGVAKALYEARKSLVEKLKLTRFMAGCRIPGYHKHADRLSPQDYMVEVRNGRIDDLVLSFMIRQGMTPVQVMENYLDDEESKDCAVIVEWKRRQS
ncbi:GNAT family N-acetyltransferase [Alteribacter salitolerans]|uniref:GNAT family N-acetyltransferase n=1 Tax=Alteribacter salitolerans TaxID=2912333 RepID=UPI001F44A424|nr:GNAT family N-acetyltransferase [Alteribacter salitolerans]